MKWALRVVLVVVGVRVWSEVLRWRDRRYREWLEGVL